MTNISKQLLKWKDTNVGVVTLDGHNVNGFVANDKKKIENTVNKLKYVFSWVNIPVVLHPRLVPGEFI